MQVIALPLLVALGLAACIRVIGGPERGQRLMGIAVAVAFLLAYTVSLGLPPILPWGAEQKLFYVVIACAAAGFALDYTGRPARELNMLRAALPGLILLWLAWDQLAAGVALGELALLAALWLGGSLMLTRLDRAEAAAGGLSAALMLVAAALGLAGVAALGAAPELASLAVILGASVGGLALWGYGLWLGKATRGPFGATTLFGAGGAVLGLAYGLALSAPHASQFALAILLLVFFIDLVAARIHLRDTFGSRVVGPLLFATLAAVPVLAAMGLATITSGT